VIVPTMLFVFANIPLADIEPSFNCRFAKTVAEKLVCTTPALAALDRELAEVFNNTIHQGGIDGSRLQREEQAWVANVRDACLDVSCVAGAYTRRLEILKDESLRAASPAVYEQTRPFNVSDASLAAARALIGRSCSTTDDVPGFESIRGFLPVIFDGYTVLARRRQNDRMAFLLRLDAPTTCVVSDVVALPSASAANAFLSCGGSDVPSPGIGVRFAERRSLVAYWSVDTTAGKLQRQPLGVLGADESIRCREPETGE
jgi:uncharacterized protein YecT (DUF1311 family)